VANYNLKDAETLKGTVAARLRFALWSDGSMEWRDENGNVTQRIDRNGLTYVRNGEDQQVQPPPGVVPEARKLRMQNEPNGNGTFPEGGWNGQPIVLDPTADRTITHCTGRAGGAEPVRTVFQMGPNPEGSDSQSGWIGDPGVCPTHLLQVSSSIDTVIDVQGKFINVPAGGHVVVRLTYVWRGSWAVEVVE
jgi:hypothetical protein